MSTLPRLSVSKIWRGVLPDRKVGMSGQGGQLSIVCRGPRDTIDIRRRMGEPEATPHSLQRARDAREGDLGGLGLRLDEVVVKGQDQSIGKANVIRRDVSDRD
ncbi:hypothetical protein GCM10011309_15320 [Litorimonas cladophorae]|uniref:Uncharacterized protein n=1 Tax=Litorimonas cladophorae TaxID=1220491 RepID=A0A918NGT0_9PROT|nr:hypothetical protein GCM10011309_15320 [Litorimonas cladophorae]